MQSEKKSILDLAKFLGQEVRVKFNGGREGIVVMLSLRCLVLNDVLA